MATSNEHSVGPSVAIVTVSYGSATVLQHFLNSVSLASDRPVSLVVADNLAEDLPVASMTADADGRYLALDRNYGYGGAMNAGVASLPSEIEWVLISNPDVVLEPGCIDILVAAGRNDPRIGSVGPAIMTDGLVYPSARAVPSLRTGVGHALFANIWLGNPWTRSYRRDTELTPVRRDAGWLSGACVLVRRSAFEEVGGFDDGYFMYFEDVDLGYRLTKAGYRNVYEPASTVLHTGAHSTNERSEKMIAVHHQSARRFLSQKYSGWALWPVRVTLSAGLAVRSAVVSRRSKRH